MPPTSFFERRIEDDENEEETDVKDFQSVLELAKASGAFNNLGLRWHYRSRHENLIAFSNYKFYEESSSRSPPPTPKAATSGSSSSMHTACTSEVAERTTPSKRRKSPNVSLSTSPSHPDLTLGVVTFSVTQAEAVQDAIDEARKNRRDLDRFSIAKTA